jgi:uncharacterized protein YjiS (DUF1127 family)
MSISQDFHTRPIVADARTPGLIQRAAEAFHRFANRRKTRRMLDLSPQLLDDIGLSRADVMDALTGDQDPAAVLTARRRARCAELGK